jgi:hypothetical protein
MLYLRTAQHWFKPRHFLGDYFEKHLLVEQLWCHNLSLGLATKARAWKGAG